MLTVIYYTRIIAARSMDFVVTDPGGTKHYLASILWRLDVDTDPNLLDHPSLRTCLIVLLAGSFLCTALGAYLCSRREFHVKTPEGN
jgi:hypothetical protein